MRRLGRVVAVLVAYCAERHHHREDQVKTRFLRAVGTFAMLGALVGTAPTAATAGPETTLSSGTNQKCVTDGGYVVRICITQYWNDFYSGGRHYVQVTKYTGVFKKLDSTWGWKDAVMKAGVNGPCWSGCSFLSQGTTKSIGSPSSGYTYTLVPSWSKYYTAVDPQVSWFQHGWGDIVVFRGTRSYHVTTPYVEA